MFSWHLTPVPAISPASPLLSGLFPCSAAASAPQPCPRRRGLHPSAARFVPGSCRGGSSDPRFIPDLCRGVASARPFFLRLCTGGPSDPCPSSRSLHQAQSNKPRASNSLPFHSLTNAYSPNLFPLILLQMPRGVFRSPHLRAHTKRRKPFPFMRLLYSSLFTRGCAIPLPLLREKRLAPSLRRCAAGTTPPNFYAHLTDLRLTLSGAPLPSEECISCPTNTCAAAAASPKKSLSF